MILSSSFIVGPLGLRTRAISLLLLLLLLLVAASLSLSACMQKINTFGSLTSPTHLLHYI